MMQNLAPDKVIISEAILGAQAMVRDLSQGKQVGQTQLKLLEKLLERAAELTKDWSIHR
jgi:hypothetical protein